MKIWIFALIAGLAGFIHGATSSEPPFPSLQEAAVSIRRLAAVWWADRMANRADLAFTKSGDAVGPDPDSKDTTSMPSGGNRSLGITQDTVFDEEINKPTDWNSNGEPQSEMAGVLVTEQRLSVDANKLKLLDLLEHLSEKCDIELVGKDALANKVVSAKFDSMKVEDGIRHLMRIGRMENYALSYRTCPGGQYAVSQIMFLPGDDDLEEYRIAKAGPEVDSTMPDYRKDGFLGDDLPAKVPKGMLADIQAEIRTNVPEEMRAETLAEILGGPTE
jgi:hypothetical protein